MCTSTKEFAEDIYNKAKHGGGGGRRTLPWIEYETTSSRRYIHESTYMNGINK